MPTLWSLSDAAQERGGDVLVGTHAILLVCHVVDLTVGGPEHLVVIICRGGVSLLAAVAGVITSGETAARIVIQVEAGEGRGEVSERVLKRLFAAVLVSVSVGAALVWVRIWHNQAAAAPPVGAGGEPRMARLVGLDTRPTPAGLAAGPYGRGRRFGIEFEIILALAFGRQTSEETGEAFLLLLVLVLVGLIAVPAVVIGCSAAACVDLA